MNHSSTFLSVWAKTNDYWGFWENFKRWIWKPHWKIDFLTIFYQIFQELCHSTKLLKITEFFTQIFGLRGNLSASPWAPDETFIFSFIVVSNFSCLELSSGLIRSDSRRMGSSLGEAEGRNFSPPPNGKNCCRNLVLSYTSIILSERRQNSKKYLVKNCEIVNIPQILKSKNQKNWKFSFTFGRNAQGFAGMLLNHSCPPSYALGRLGSSPRGSQ